MRQVDTVRKSLSTESVETVVDTLMTSWLDYCNSVFIRSLQPVYKLCSESWMQLVDLSCASSDIMTIQHLTMCADLRWLAIRQQIVYKLWTIVDKCLDRPAHQRPIWLKCALHLLSALPSVVSIH